jgi:hypothetical protein
VAVVFFISSALCFASSTTLRQRSKVFVVLSMFCPSVGRTLVKSVMFDSSSLICFALSFELSVMFLYFSVNASASLRYLSTLP